MHSGGNWICRYAASMAKNKTFSDLFGEEKYVNII